MRVGVRCGSTLSSHDTAAKQSLLEPWKYGRTGRLLPGSTLLVFVSLYRLIQNRGKADGCAAESNTAAAHVLIGK